MNTTVWDFSNTGSKFHAFINGQTAACRSSIAVPLQFKQNATTLAKAGQLASDRPGVTVCQRCTAKFTAAMHRYQASMAPSTGEGDHLPPTAEVVADPLAPTEDGLLCAVPLMDVFTGRIAYCTKFRHHSRVVGGPEHRIHPTHDRAAEMTEALAEDTRRTAAKQETITPDLVEALATIRNQPGRTTEEALANILEAFEVLDNAGIFAAIDQAVGKCTCPPSYAANDYHEPNCPEAPERARMGDCKCGKGKLFREHLMGCPATTKTTSGPTWDDVLFRKEN